MIGPNLEKYLKKNPQIPYTSEGPGHEKPHNS